MQLEVRQKYSTARRIFNSQFLEVCSNTVFFVIYFLGYRSSYSPIDEVAAIYAVVAVAVAVAV